MTRGSRGRPLARAPGSARGVHIPGVISIDHMHGTPRRSPTRSIMIDRRPRGRRSKSATCIPRAHAAARMQPRECSASAANACKSLPRPLQRSATLLIIPWPVDASRSVYKQALPDSAIIHSYSILVSSFTFSRERSLTRAACTCSPPFFQASDGSALTQATENGYECRS